jgi:hypothetical protein
VNAVERTVGPSTTDRLLRLGPIVLGGAGAALLVLAAYMAGEDTLHCGRTNGRVDCVVTRHRWFGHVVDERQSAADVVNVGVHTSTSSTTWTTSSGNLETTTTSNDVLVLHTRDGHDTDTLGGEESGKYAAAVTALIKTPVPADGRAGPSTVDLADSSWPVAIACGGIGLFLFGFGAIAFYVQRKETG